MAGVEIPRSHERGHIEALICGVAFAVWLRFRAHMSAATLKHGAIDCVLSGFRAHMSAATLKRGFRAHMSAATLKQAIIFRRP